jgi:hypothetical protein
VAKEGIGRTTATVLTSELLRSVNVFSSLSALLAPFFLAADLDEPIAGIRLCLAAAGLAAPPNLIAQRQGD